MEAKYSGLSCVFVFRAKMGLFSSKFSVFSVPLIFQPVLELEGRP